MSLYSRHGRHLQPEVTFFMFAAHQKEIEKYARENADHVCDVARFVLITIRRRFDLVDKFDGRGTAMTLKGLQYCRDHKDSLYAACYTPGLTDAERLVLLTAVPGIGLVKAGFILQLTTGRGGCLDTHNIKRFGLDAKDFANCKNLLPRAELYLRTCERIGGSAYLWDSWCQLVADKYQKVWGGDAEAVSRYHVECIVK